MRGILNKLEQASILDRPGFAIQRMVQGVLRPQRVRDFLHGTWLGHPLHPAMVQIPLGTWTSAAVLDMMKMKGYHRASTTLITVGTASAIPTAVAGLNDWAGLSREQRRVGLIHALSNITAVGLYVGSLVARYNGRDRSGRTLSYLGLTASGVGGYLGGHLAYKQAAQVNQGAPELHYIQEGWHSVGDLGSIPSGELVTRQVDGVAVLVYRDGSGDGATVMLDRCAHQGGPLGEGSVVKMDGHMCVVCPWHGSTFQLDSGEVVHGPAGTDQQVLPSRVVSGVLETRLP